MSVYPAPSRHRSVTFERTFGPEANTSRGEEKRFLGASQLSCLPPVYRVESFASEITEPRLFPTFRHNRQTGTSRRRLGTICGLFPSRPAQKWR